MSVWARLAPRRRRATVMAAGAVVGAALACVGSLVYQGGTYAYFSDSVSVQVTITVDGAPGGKAASPQQAARAPKAAGTSEAATSSGASSGASPAPSPQQRQPATPGEQGGGSEDAAPAAPSPVVPAPSGAPEPPAPLPSLAPARQLPPLPSVAPKLAPVAPAPQLAPPAVRPDSLVAHVPAGPRAAASVVGAVSGLGG